MKYTKEQKDAILAKIENLAKEVGSMSKVCALTGVSAAIMSGIRKGTYHGDEDKQFDVLESYLKVREEAQKAESTQDGGYVPTSVSENVYAIIQNCQLKGGLAIACGDAGIGKTRAARKFADDHPNHAMLVTVNPCIKGTRSVLKVMCDKLSVSEKTVDEMWLGVAGKLRDKMVLIFDEAQHLPIKTIESLRAFSDYFAEKGQTLGIVFIGNMEAVHNFAGNKRADFAQIVNRTKQNRQYYTSQITREDIEKLFPTLAGHDKEIDFMHAVAQSKQAIRGAANLFSNAVDNENVTYDGLVAMAKSMEMAV